MNLETRQRYYFYLQVAKICTIFIVAFWGIHEAPNGPFTLIYFKVVEGNQEEKRFFFKTLDWELGDF